jgi:amino acid adenylation domain-containing protein
VNVPDAFQRLPRAVPQLHDYLEQSAQRLPDKVALVSQGRRVTYAELDRDANRFAHALARRGVTRGDRVVIFADNTLETAIAFWGALKASAVVSIVSPLTKADKLAHVLRDCGAAAMVSEAHLGRTFVEAAPQAPALRTTVVSGPLAKVDTARLPGFAAWDEALASGDASAPPPRRTLDVDLAAIIYTSGSTGDPKGIMLTHRNMLTAATSITAYLGNVEDDVILNGLPLSFDYGLYQMIMAFRMGARLVLERSFAYPAQILATLVRERVTGFPGVPTVFAMMAEMKNLSDYDFSSVRYVTNTAAALSLKHIDFIRTTFASARVFSMYGLTECKRCTYLPPEDIDRKPLSVGIAIPDTELWIVDEQDNRLGPNQVGQLVIRGATVMRGYWGKPEATAEKLRPGPLPGELVLYTGDYCRLDEDGYLYFVGRMDEVIKSRGEKVAPEEVERALMKIPGVKEAGVTGVPDAVLGHAIKAFIILEPGAALTEQAVKIECQARLENFMVPKHVVFVTALPRTTNGKIARAELS